MKNRDEPTLFKPSRSGLPSWAHILSAIGTETEAAVQGHFDDAKTSVVGLFGRQDDEPLKSFAKALSAWTDEHAAQMFQICVEHGRSPRPVDLMAVSRWIMLHRDDPESVLDCMNVDPPPEIDVIRVLSRAGSQKLVFEAVWRLAQKRVVLKLTRDPRILARELRSNPLSLRHPNIIETHLLKNSKSEPFLVEHWIPDVLRDDWPCEGIEEAANLLYNLADAVAFLHKEGLVHGDIKPDNIGKENDAFLLLDFGICRPAAEFTHEVTATGSLRTRAPEILVQDDYADAKKADVWAIGATVFNFLEARFPLIDRSEYIPRITEKEQRSRFELELKQRVEQEWSQRVAPTRTSEPMKHLIELALTKEPGSRPTAAELKEMAEKELPAFLRRESHANRFAPLDEFNQLRTHLPPSDVLELMPADERRRIRNRLRELKETTGFNDNQKGEIDRIYHLINV